MSAINHSTDIPSLTKCQLSTTHRAQGWLQRWTSSSPSRGLQSKPWRVLKSEIMVLFCFVKAMWCLDIVHGWLLREWQGTGAWTEAHEQIQVTSSVQGMNWEPVKDYKPSQQIPKLEFFGSTKRDVKRETLVWGKTEFWKIWNNVLKPFYSYAIGVTLQFHVVVWVQLFTPLIWLLSTQVAKISQVPVNTHSSF